MARPEAPLAFVCQRTAGRSAALIGAIGIIAVVGVFLAVLAVIDLLGRASRDSRHPLTQVKAAGLDGR